MTKFCGNCGNLLNETSVFCGGCGARVPQANVPLVASPVSPLPPAPLPPPVSPLPRVYPAAAPLPAVRQGSSPVIKILLIVFVILIVGGALSVAGIFYALHLASRKAHEFSRQVLGNSGVLSALQTDSGNAAGSDAGTGGPGACRFLSKEDVSRAIGVPIVATKSTDASCEYFAKGTSADMTGKHLAAMMASNGANAQQQQLIQNLSRGLLGNTPNEVDKDSQGGDGNAGVMGFTIDPNSAKTQMGLNENVFGAIGPARKPLTGIGDEAFDTGGAVMMVRKGDKLIRIVYSTCPCTIEAIKPLAQELAGAL